MSVLTKLFVVLLVVCSLLLSASVVVFVNRVDNYVVSNKKAASDATAARAQATSLQNRVAEMDTTSRNAATAAAAREGELTRKLDDMQKQVQDALAAKAQAEKDLQVAQATIHGATAVAEAAQSENKGLLKLTDDLRGKSDDTLRANTELNTSLTVMSNRNRALENELRLQQERVVELTAQMRNAPKAGTSEATPTPPAPIAGKVTSVDIIGGKKYATISVGSSENVQKGMKFNVVNRQSGEFLGFLTIDRVEPNEAIGPVDGTKIDKITKDVDVRTQL